MQHRRSHVVSRQKGRLETSSVRAPEHDFTEDGLVTAPGGASAVTLFFLRVCDELNLEVQIDLAKFTTRMVTIIIMHGPHSHAHHL